MLSHLWLKNRSIVSRWKIDYAELNKHRFLAWVQMSLHRCAKAAARGDKARRACRERRERSSAAFTGRGPSPAARGVCQTRWPPARLERHLWESPGVSGRGGRAAPLAHRLCHCGTWLWKSGLIWGPERNSEKGTGAKTGAITSERRTLPLQAQGGRRWASLPLVLLVWVFFFNSVPYKVMHDPGAVRRGMLGTGMRLALSVGGMFCSSLRRP